MKLKTFTINDIRKNNPCYDPARHLSKKWKGTALDIAQHEGIPLHDVIWVLKQDERVPDEILRRFVAWCAAEALHIPKKRPTDQRSWDAVKAALRFVDGEITKEELSAARRVADVAAYAADAAADVADVACVADAYAAAYAADANAYACAADAAACVADAYAGAACAAYTTHATYSDRKKAQEIQRAKLISMLRGESSFTLSDFYNMG